MRKILFATFTLICFFTAKAELIPFDAEHFPDELFRSYLQKYKSTAISGTNIETDKVTELDLSTGAMKFTDLTGIRYFSKVTKITLPAKPTFALLDVSGMGALKTVTNGVAHNSTTNGSPSATTLAKYSGSALKRIVARNCPNLNEISVHFLDSVEDIDFEGSTAITILNCSYTKITKLDVSTLVLGRQPNDASNSQGFFFWNDNCKNLHTLIFGEQPYVTDVCMKECNLRYVDISGLTGAKYTGASKKSINFYNNKLRRIQFGKNMFGNINLIQLGSNRLGAAPDLNDFGINPGSYSISTQKIYAGKGVQRVKLFNVKDHGYYNSYSAEKNGKIVKDGDWYYFEFSSATSTASGTYTYKAGYSGTWATTTVTVYREDDPDIVSANLFLVDDNDEPTFDEIPLTHTANGIYQAQTDRLEGNYRIVERDDDGKTIKVFGGHDNDDINAADPYVWTNVEGKKYTMAHLAEKAFTTHPDQHALNTDLATKTYAYRYPKISVDYHPEMDDYTIALSAEPQLYLAGTKHVWMIQTEDFENHLTPTTAGVYEVSMPELEGNFRVQMVDGYGNVTHDFGAEPAPQTLAVAPGGTYRHVELNNTYNLVENSPVLFTTHPDQDNGGLVKYESTKVTINYGTNNTLQVQAEKTTGVDNILAGDNVDDEESAQYFDLQGRRVVNPSNGIFIRRNGTKTTKVIR